MFVSLSDCHVTSPLVTVTGTAHSSTEIVEGSPASSSQRPWATSWKVNLGDGFLKAVGHWG